MGYAGRCPYHFPIRWKIPKPCQALFFHLFSCGGFAVRLGAAEDSHCYVVGHFQQEAAVLVGSHDSNSQRFVSTRGSHIPYPNT